MSKLFSCFACTKKNKNKNYDDIDESKRPKDRKDKKSKKMKKVKNKSKADDDVFIRNKNDGDVKKFNSSIGLQPTETTKPLNRGDQHISKETGDKDLDNNQLKSLDLTKHPNDKNVKIPLVNAKSNDEDSRIDRLNNKNDENLVKKMNHEESPNLLDQIDNVLKNKMSESGDGSNALQVPQIQIHNTDGDDDVDVVDGASNDNSRSQQQLPKQQQQQQQLPQQQQQLPQQQQQLPHQQQQLPQQQHQQPHQLPQLQQPIKAMHSDDEEDDDNESCLTDSDLNISEATFIADAGPKVSSNCLNQSRGGFHTLKPAHVLENELIERASANSARGRKFNNTMPNIYSRSFYENDESVFDEDKRISIQIK